MQMFNEWGQTTRVTATGTLIIGASGSKMALLGMFVGACQTAPMVQIWQGPASGSTTLIGICTLPLNAFARMPMYCSGGAYMWFSNCIAPDITIYWNPLG